MAETVKYGAIVYLYDVADAVAEMESGTALAQMLVGGGDEVFIRTDEQGSRSLLHDGVNKRGKAVLPRI